MPLHLKTILKFLGFACLFLMISLEGASAASQTTKKHHHAKAKHHHTSSHSAKSKHKKTTAKKTAVLQEVTKQSQHKRRHSTKKKHVVTKHKRHHNIPHTKVVPAAAETEDNLPSAIDVQLLDEHETTGPNNSDNSARIVQQIAIPFMRRNHIPGLAVEIYDKGVPHSYYFGYANRERRYPVTGNTIFEIASITKLFTALLMAQEIKAGKMSLNDPVIKHVPSLAAQPGQGLRNVTLKNLGTHTAILPFNLPHQVNNRSKLSSYLSRWRPFAPIGSRWRYSNVSIGLLGVALEAETHQNINGLYRSRILRPLGMQPLGVNVDDAFQQFYAQGYAGNGRAAPRRNGSIWLTPPSGEWMFPAAGAIKASSKDMALFLKAAIGLPGTPQNILDAMRLTQTPFFSGSGQEQGLAWVIHPNPKNNREELLNPATSLVLGSVRVHQLDESAQRYQADALMEKTGATGGFRSYIAVIPKEKSGVVLLMNKYISSRELKKTGRNIMLSLD